MALGMPYLACGGNAGTGSATLAVTVTHTTAAGDAIAVWAASTNSVTPSSVTDSKGNFYYGLDQVTSGAVSGRWFVSLNSSKLTSGTDTITLTVSGTSGSKALSAIGCSGVALNTAYDQNVTAAGTSTAPSVTGTALQDSPELALAGLASQNAGGAVTWGGAFASPAVSDSEHSSGGVYGQVAVVTRATSAKVTASGTLGASVLWGAALLTLRRQVTILGASIDTGSWNNAPSGVTKPSTQAQAISFFDSYAGRPYATGASKVYYQEGAWPSSLDAKWRDIAAAGAVALLCLKPAHTSSGTYTDSTVTTSGTTCLQEKNSLTAALTMWKNAYAADGFPALGMFKAAIWQEANDQGSSASAFPGTGAQFKSYFAYYSAAIQAAGVARVYDPGGGDPANWAPYYPGDSHVDEIVCDFYCSGYNSGKRLDGGSYQYNLMTLADSHKDGNGVLLPIPFGIGEFNCDATGTQVTVTQWNAYIAYLTSLFHGRLAQGKANGLIMYWMGIGAKATIPASPPGTANGLWSSSDPKVPGGTNAGGQGLQTLFDALQPGAAGVASITGTFSLTASGQDISGTTKSAAAAIRGTFSLSATGSTGTKPSAQILTFFTLVTNGAGLAVILQQAEGTATFDYGLSSIEMSTTQGSWLVLLAGWDLSAAPVTAPMPALNVSDSAGNLWRHVAHTSSGVTGARAAAWVAPNAQPIEWLSASLTTFASSLAYKVLELNGNVMPDDYVLDVTDATSAASAQSLALMPGVTSGAGFAFAVLAAGSFTPPPVVTGNTGWSPLSTVTAGAVPSGANPVQIFPYYQAVGAGTNLNTTFTASQALPAAGAVFSVLATPLPPAQPDPQFPVLKVEAGFGWLPGDPSQAPPSWTDITNRCMSKDGDYFIQTSAGRQYELATPEAGTMTIGVLNADGAFTPGNASSPFYPNVTLGTPIRVSAYWQGAWYAVASGFVERWPQEWPDLPQFGMSRMVATDGIAAMAAVTMVSAMDADVLIDAPYVLLPAAEQYLSFSNGLNSFGGSGFAALGYYSVADAQGLAAQNASRINQRAGVYVDGQGTVPRGTSNAIAATGQTTNLLGTSGTGFGTSSIGTDTAASGPLSGPGIVYTDPNMPDPVTAPGVTVSFWVIISATVSVASLQPTVFTAYGPPTSYPSGKASLSVQIMNLTGSSTLQVTLADGTTVTAPFSVAASPQRITLTLTSSSLGIYVNGALEATTGLSAAQTTAWNAVSLGAPNYAYASAGTTAGNFTAFGLAMHACVLPVQRIVSQYNTGISGQQNATATARLAQILSWAGLSLPRSGRATFNGTSENILQGPAYSLSGATAAAALGQVVVNESGMAAAQPTGEVEFIPKWGLLNQSPVVTFGDNPDPSSGEIPYQPAQSWGFDNSYLASLFQVAQQYGANTLSTAVGADFTSEQQYSPRSGQQVTIQTMSSLDATDLVNWLLAKYSQPGLRVAAITIDAASNPQVAFSAILPLRQGQVATVIRRPLGAPVIQQNCLVQKVTHQIGAKTWLAGYQLSPYDLEANVLQLDVTGSDVVGNNALA